MKPSRPDPRYERWRWQILAITWLAYAGFYLTRKSFAAAKVIMGEGTDVGLTEAEMGTIDAVNLTAYAVGQFICGVFGDRLGTRKIILLGMGVSIAAAFAMGATLIFAGALPASLTPLLMSAIGMSPAMLLFVLFFGIQGLCQSAGWAPLSKNIAHFFSQHERGRVMGWWCTNYAMGGAIALAFAGWACQQFGWQYAFWIPAIGLGAVWLLFAFLQRNRPEDVGLPPIEEYHGEAKAVLEEGDSAADEPEGSWKTIGEVIVNPMILLLSAVYFFMKSTRYMIFSWAPVYVKYRLGSQAFESSAVSAMFDLAGVLGALAAGYLSDKMFRSRRMPPSTIALLLLAPVLLLFNYLPASRMALGTGFFLVGFLLFIPDSLVSGTAAIDFGTKRGASTAAGLINGFGSIGAIFGAKLPNFVEAALGGKANQWHWVFGILALSILLAGLILLPKWNAMPPTAKEEKRA